MSKISGKFTKKDFQVAIYNYLMAHPREINKYRQRFGTGQSAFSKGVALAIKELTQQYYGNKN
jgi:hypothetical protein